MYLDMMTTAVMTAAISEMGMAYHTPSTPKTNGSRMMSGSRKMSLPGEREEYTYLHLAYTLEEVGYHHLVAH